MPFQMAAMESGCMMQSVLPLEVQPLNQEILFPKMAETASPYGIIVNLTPSLVMQYMAIQIWALISIGTQPVSR